MPVGQQWRGLALLDQRRELRVVVREFVVEGTDPLGQSDSFGPCDREGEIFGAAAPSSDLGDQPVTQGSAGVESQVGCAEQSGERVDACGAFGADVLPRSSKGSQRGTDAVVGSGPTQLVGAERQDRGSDAVRVEWIGLPDVTVSFRVHPGSLGHLIAGIGYHASEPGTEVCNAFDDPQCG